MFGSLPRAKQSPAQAGLPSCVGQETVAQGTPETLRVFRGLADRGPRI